MNLKMNFKLKIRYPISKPDRTSKSDIWMEREVGLVRLGRTNGNSGTNGVD